MSNELTHNTGQFDEVIHIIDNARSRAMKAVNAELIQMYWSVGAYLSELQNVTPCRRHSQRLQFSYNPQKRLDKIF